MQTFLEAKRWIGSFSAARTSSDAFHEYKDAYQGSLALLRGLTAGGWGTWVPDGGRWSAMIDSKGRPAAGVEFSDFVKGEKSGPFPSGPSAAWGPGLFIDIEAGTYNLSVLPVTLTVRVRSPGVGGTIREWEEPRMVDGFRAELQPLPAGVGALTGRAETSLGAGSSVASWSISPLESGCRIHTIKVWFNAFIPRDVSGKTFPVPGPLHQGKTMVEALVWNDCFLTDQRTFSGDPQAASRAHSEMRVDVDSLEMSQHHSCDESVEVDCEQGGEDCRHKAPTDKMSFSDFSISEDGRTISAKLAGAANNGCYRGSPDIDYEGTVTMALDNLYESATVSFAGLIDEFPAYEMYTAVNDGPAQQLFAIMPEPGKDPSDLFGRANRPVQASASVACRDS